MVRLLEQVRVAYRGHFTRDMALKPDKFNKINTKPLLSRHNSGESWILRYEAAGKACHRAER
jgi:hypothetical protein